MEGKRNSRQEQKWTKRLRGGILAGVLPVRDAKQQPGLRVTLSTRTSYPGEGSYNTERPILLGANQWKLEVPWGPGKWGEGGPTFPTDLHYHGEATLYDTMVDTCH